MTIFPKNWRQVIWAVVRAYVLLLAVVYLFQDYLLYHPSTYSLEQTRELAAQMGLKLWPTDDANYRGYVPIQSARPPGTPVRGTILVVHGNAGSAIHRICYVAALEPLGFRVVLYEYPGFGAREGKWGSASFVSDLRAVIRQLNDSQQGPVYLWGESLGCGVVAQTVSDPTLPVAGVILLAPWDRLANVAQSRFPFLPARWLVRDKFDSVANLAGFKRPVVVIRLGRDEVIPTECEQHLYDTLPQPKKLIVHPEATHNNWPSDPSLPWWREAVEFMVTGNNK